MKKNELMGKRVTVNKEFWRTEYPNKEYYPMNVSLTGWIVGFRTIQDGISVFWGDDEPAVWEPTGYHKCVLVSLTPHQNPIKVPLDGFELIGDSME